MPDCRKPLVLVALHFIIPTVFSSHFRGGIIMVRPVLDEDLRGSGEGLPVVMPTQVYHVSNRIYMIHAAITRQLHVAIYDIYNTI